MSPKSTYARFLRAAENAGPVLEPLLFAQAEAHLFFSGNLYEACERIRSQELPRVRSAIRSLTPSARVELLSNFRAVEAVLGTTTFSRVQHDKASMSENWIGKVEIFKLLVACRMAFSREQAIAFLKAPRLQIMSSFNIDEQFFAYKARVKDLAAALSRDNECREAVASFCSEKARSGTPRLRECTRVLTDAVAPPALCELIMNDVDREMDRILEVDAMRRASLSAFDFRNQTDVRWLAAHAYPHESAAFPSKSVLADAGLRLFEAFMAGEDISPARSVIERVHKEAQAYIDAGNERLLTGWAIWPGERKLLQIKLAARMLGAILAWTSSQARPGRAHASDAVVVRLARDLPKSTKPSARWLRTAQEQLARFDFHELADVFVTAIATYEPRIVDWMEPGAEQNIAMKKIARTWVALASVYAVDATAPALEVMALRAFAKPKVQRGKKSGHSVHAEGVGRACLWCLSVLKSSGGRDALRRVRNQLSAPKYLAVIDGYLDAIV